MTIPFELRRYLIIGFIILVVLAVVASSAVVGYTLLSQASNDTIMDETPPAEKLAPPTPNQQSTPSAIPQAPKRYTPPPISTPSSTISGWQVTGSASVDIVPSFSLDYKNMYVDYQSFSLFQVTLINYTLSYTADPGVIRQIKGVVNPVTDSATQINGKPTIRKVITLGTCSGVNCTYDSNPRNFTLVNLVKTNNGLTTTLKTLTLSGQASASGAL